MSKGWIRKYRQVMDHPFYLEKRVFSRYEAWDYILMRANHSDSKTMIKNNMVTIKRGSFVTSDSQLMERFQWGKEKLRNFLKLCESDGMIEKETASTHTTITVTNYDRYQSKSDQQTDHDEPYSHAVFEVLPDQQADRFQTANRPQTDREPDTNKELKNEKKNKYAPNVSLTVSEYGRLLGEFGEETVKASIEYLDSYKIEKGYKTKDDNKTIRRWVIKAVNEGRGSSKVSFIGAAKVKTKKPDYSLYQDERNYDPL